MMGRKNKMKFLTLIYFYLWLFLTSKYYSFSACVAASDEMWSHKTEILLKNKVLEHLEEIKSYFFTDFSIFYFTSFILGTVRSECMNIYELF